METSILFTSFPVIDIKEYQTSINTTYSFYQAYKAIAENDSKERLSNLDHLKTEAKEGFTNKIVSLGILNSAFEVIKPDAFDNGDLTIDAEGYLIKTSNAASIYNKHELAIVAPLQIKHKGLEVNFSLSEDNIFNTSSKTITNIKVDFGDGEGFKTLSENNNSIVNYTEKGSKTLISELTFSDGTSSTSKSSIDVNYSNADLNTLFNRVINTFESTNTTAPLLTPYGETDLLGTGEYEIFLSADNILDKPIFLIDGFDPGDGRDITGLYDLLSFDDNGTESNLADVVRAEGFDVVILNFPVYTRASDNAIVDGGADFIERNAMLLVELIKIINNQKIGTEENVVIGPSMGGLISRYALNFMENQNEAHETRLWLSFDSPHNGANVPIGFQYLFNKMAYGLQLGGFAGDQSLEALRPLVDDFLRSPAAKQMLVDHFDAHITAGTDFDTALMLPQKHPWNDIFFNGLDGMSGLKNLTASGFPENLRKASMINGSGIGSPYQDKNGMDIAPDFLALNVDNLVIGSGLTSADGDFTARFTPLAGLQNTTGSIDIDAPFLCFCDFSASAAVQSESFSNGVDAASGGLFNIGGLTGSLGTDPLIIGFLAGLQTDFFNFIPTVSAMALENDGEIDWFHVPNNLTTSSLTVTNVTPFDAWYMPDDNEGHVTLTSANVNFALDEIIIRSSLASKAYLQGALLGSTDNMMRDDLRVAGIIPTTSPYSDGLTIPASVLSATGNNAIVDWVFVELRDATSNTTIIASQSALLQRDGDIVNLDGISNLPFNNIPANSYFVAVKQRNHLAMMSNTAIPLSRIATTVDFTDANNQITFGTNAQTTFGVPTNKVAMWAGNVNGDTVIQYSGTNPDSPSILSDALNAVGNFLNLPTYIVNGYNLSDVNMNGDTQYTGTTPDTPYILQNTLSHPGNFLNLSTFSIQEQLPEN